MSYETWKEEFYPPIPKPLDALTAARHSLKKWEGFTTGNLAKHDLIYDGFEVFEGESASMRRGAPIYQDDCALCRYTVYDEDEDVVCEECPLVLNGEKACDQYGSPYKIFRRDHNPVPLIEALRATVEYLEQNE